MIQTFDTAEAERYGLVPAIVLYNIRNAITLQDDRTIPEWQITENNFQYIHRYIGKKSLNDATAKLIKLGIIQIDYLEDGTLSISTTRFLG